MEQAARFAGLATRSVGEVVAEDYARAAVLRQKGIDFCCGGGRTVGDACRRAGITVEELARALSAADRSNSSGMLADPRRWDPDLLAEYIVRTHHRYVRESLPVLAQFWEKVARVHGETKPELVEIRDLVTELAGEMTEHMREEEDTLFPAIRVLVASGERDATRPAASPSGGEAEEGDPAAEDPTPEVQAMLEGLEDDHERAGSVLGRIRELSSDFVPPAGACATWRAAYAKLEEFEEDLHLHVHLENNVLFPAVAERSSS